MEAYQGMDHEKMYANYKYFLDAVIPTCERYDVKLAVHPDDPAFALFGWLRMVSSKEGILTGTGPESEPLQRPLPLPGSLLQGGGVDEVKTL